MAGVALVLIGLGFWFAYYVIKGFLDGGEQPTKGAKQPQVAHGDTSSVEWKLWLDFQTEVLNGRNAKASYDAFVEKFAETVGPARLSKEWEERQEKARVVLLALLPQMAEGRKVDEAAYQQWCMSEDKPLNVEAHLSVLYWVGIVSGTDIGANAAEMICYEHLRGNVLATLMLQGCYKFVMLDPLLSAGLVANIYKRFPLPPTATEDDHLVSTARCVFRAVTGNWVKSINGEGLSGA